MSTTVTAPAPGTQSAPPPPAPNPIWAFLAPLLAPVPLVRSHQDAGAHPRPFATYRVTRAADPRHAVATWPDAEGIATLRAHRSLSVEVQTYGPGAEAAADRLQLRLKADTAAQAAETLGFSLSLVRPAQHVPALLDSARWEERGVVEFTAYALAEAVDPVGLIERAETEGEYREAGVAAPALGTGRATVRVVARPAPAEGGRGVAALEFLGALVEPGLYPVIPSAPYPLTPVALDHEVGAEGGSFTASLVRLRGPGLAEETPAGVTALTVDAPARRTVDIPAAVRAPLAPGDRLAVRIADVTGEPSGAVLAVHFVR